MILLAIQLLLTGQGDLFFNAGLFDKAAREYSQQGLRLKEIESLYFAKEYQAIVKKLDHQNPVGEERYFLALAHQMLGHKEKMFQVAQDYLADPTHDPKRSAAFKNHFSLLKAQALIANGALKEAEEILSPLQPTPEGLYQLIQVKEMQKAPKEEIAPLLQTLLALEPTTPFHAAAFFEYYTFQDYLLGKKEALVHLKEHVKRFPDTPYSLMAWYLIGLDLKRERKSDSGRRVHAKNLEQAIEAFHKAETGYTKLQPQLPAEDKEYWENIKNYATLERARTLIEIAQHSSSAKKHIYLTYAIDTLEPLSSLEARLLLADVYSEEGEKENSLKELNKLEKFCRQQYPKQNYYLAKTLLSKGRLYYTLGEPEKGISLLEEGISLAPKHALTTDELLEAQITKGLCLKDLNELDKAMLVMSEVINSEMISSLRVKAMYFRALIYESQGRLELAKRQLEATLSKGGEWAELAKDKWTKEYHE